jgi:hypothetical protein
MSTSWPCVTRLEIKELWPLYETFIDRAELMGARELKAIANPENQGSTAMHERMGSPCTATTTMPRRASPG